jgi:hypothetical protein
MKIRALYTTNSLIGGLYFDSLTLLFWFDIFLKAGTEILEKKIVVFLEDLKTPQGHFEINWPLVKPRDARSASARDMNHG